ncbi:MAG: hypothetical protein U0236_14835 [Nitrospira sp.]
MTPDIPRSGRHRTVGETIAALQGHTWDEVGHVYLVDDQAVLMGRSRSSDCFKPRNRPRWPTGRTPSDRGAPGRWSGTVALRAVERHDADVAVIDGRVRLLGAIPIGRLLALLHEEHLDNFLRMGGVSRIVASLAHRATDSRSRAGALAMVTGRPGRRPRGRRCGLGV